MFCTTFSLIFLMAQGYPKGAKMVRPKLQICFECFVALHPDEARDCYDRGRGDIVRGYEFVAGKSYHIHRYNRCASSKNRYHDIKPQSKPANSDRRGKKSRYRHR